MSPLNSDLLRSRFDREAKKADLRERSSRTKSAYSYSENSEVFPVRFTQYTRVAVLPSEALSEPILPGGVCNLPGDEIQCDDLGCFEALEDAEKIFNLGKWSSSVWAFKELFRETLAKMALIENDLFSDRKSHFFHCEKPVQAGKVGLRKSDGSPVYTKRMRCYDPVCPDCRDFDREKQAGELVRLTDLILRNHTGCSRVFRFQFTIPAEIESLPFSDKALQAKLLNGVQCVLRKAFGFSYRSNLAIFMNVHPVGDSDVMRDRWHVHVYVIPCEISEGRLTWSKVTWFDPKELQRMWSEVVGSHVIPPQISYVDVSKEGWKGRLYEKLRYDLRGFGADLEKSVIATNKGAHLVGVHCPEGIRVLHGMVISDRYLRIRKRNQVGSRGFLKCIDRYSEVLGFCRQDLELKKDLVDQDDIIEVDAEVNLYRKSGYTRKGGRFLHRDELYIYLCPVTGKVITLARSKMADMADYDMDMWALRKSKMRGG